MAITKKTVKAKNENGETIASPESIKVLRARFIKEGMIVFDMLINGCIIIKSCFYRSGISKKTGAEYELISLPEYRTDDGEYHSYVYIKYAEGQKEDIINQIDNLINSEA